MFCAHKLENLIRSFEKIFVRKVRADGCLKGSGDDIEAYLNVQIDLYELVFWEL